MSKIGDNNPPEHIDDDKQAVIKFESDVAELIEDIKKLYAPYNNDEPITSEHEGDLCEVIKTIANIRINGDKTRKSNKQPFMDWGNRVQNAGNELESFAKKVEKHGNNKLIAIAEERRQEAIIEAAERSEEARQTQITAQAILAEQGKLSSGDIDEQINLLRNSQTFQISDINRQVMSGKITSDEGDSRESELKEKTGNAIARLRELQKQTKDAIAEVTQEAVEAEQAEIENQQLADNIAGNDKLTEGAADRLGIEYGDANKGLRQKYTGHRVIDINQVPSEFLILDEKKVNAVLRAGAKIDGLEAIFETVRNSK